MRPAARIGITTSEPAHRAPVSQWQRDRAAGPIHPMFQRRPWPAAIRDALQCGAIITFTGVALVVAAAAFGA